MKTKPKLCLYLAICLLAQFLQCKERRFEINLHYERFNLQNNTFVFDAFDISKEDRGALNIKIDTSQKALELMPLGDLRVLWFQYHKNFNVT